MPVKSACTNLPKENCLPPDCTYVNGASRKYCRSNTNKTKKVKIKTPTPVRVKTPTPVRVKTPTPECKGLQKEYCLPPNCQFINGKTRKYCAKARTQKNVSRSPIRKKSIKLKPSLIK